MDIEAKLLELETLMAKASLLPWGNTDTAEDLLGVKTDDWWKIYALNRPEEELYRPYHVVCSMAPRATEEEEAAARKAYFYPEGDHVMRDPGVAGDEARFITAACNAIPELISTIRELKAKNAEFERELHGKL